MIFFTLFSLIAAVSAHFEILTPQSRGVEVNHATMNVFPCGDQPVTPLASRNVFPMTGGSIMIDNGHSSSPFLVYVAPTDVIASTNNGTGQPGPNQYSSATLISPAVNYTQGAQVLTITDLKTLAIQQNPNANVSFIQPGAQVTLQVVQTGKNNYVQCADVILVDSSDTLVNSCVADPSQANCAGAYYTGSQKDLTSLCSAAPSLSACSFAGKCVGNLSQSGLGGYCNPWSLLASACTKDVPSLPTSLTNSLTQCKTYNGLCGVGSVVQQCKNGPGVLKDFIPVMQVTKQFQSMCEEMSSMSGCQKCAFNNASLTSWSNCDQLSVYTSMCLSMPKHTQCVDQKAMCATRPEDNISPDISTSEYCYLSSQSTIVATTTGSVQPTTKPSSSANRLLVGFLLVFIMI